MEVRTQAVTGYAAALEASEDVIEYVFRVQNAGSSPAYDVCFGAELSFLCESNERAIVAGRRAPFRFFADEARVKHWALRDAVTSKHDFCTGRDILPGAGCPADVLLRGP